MDIEQLEKRLEFWKRGLLVALGASVTFFVTTLGENPQKGISGSRYFIQLILWLTIAPPGFYLLLNSKWRKVSLSKRLNTAFGYLDCAWLVLLSALMKGFLSTHAYNIGIWIFIFLFATYWYLRRKKDRPEEMFP